LEIIRGKKRKIKRPPARIDTLRFQENTLSKERKPSWLKIPTISKKMKGEGKGGKLLGGEVSDQTSLLVLYEGVV